MLEIVEYLKAQMETRVSNTERGAAAVEYGMLVALIAAVIVGIVFHARRPESRALSRPFSTGLTGH